VIEDGEIAEKSGDADEKGVEGKFERGGIFFEAPDGFDGGTDLKCAEAGGDATAEGGEAVSGHIERDTREEVVEEEAVSGGDDGCVGAKGLCKDGGRGSFAHGSRPAVEGAARCFGALELNVGVFVE
jgi:hypothetical protein